MAFRENKRIIPVLVRDARMPPPDVLPETLKALPGRQDISLRRDYWDHDVKLLVHALINSDIIPEIIAYRAEQPDSDWRFGPWRLWFGQA